MIVDPLNIQRDYEHTRLARYGAEPRDVYYSPEDMIKAYLAWANHPYGREHQWDSYSDVRDGVPWGTNARIRKKRQDNRFH